MPNGIKRTFSKCTTGYTKMVIATLPTLRVRYRDKNIDITTDEIKNVTIGNFLYSH